MNNRVSTAFPSTRQNARHFTDVTFHPSLSRFKSKNQPCSYTSPVARPFTTIGAPRRSPSEAPPNFSWVDQGWLAASAMPTTPSHYKYLFENGIRHVVSLMKQKPQGALECVQLPKLNRLKIRIDDFCAPTLNQIKNFIRIVEDANDRNEAVGVHCANGNGSSGTMLACYLVKTKKISARDALERIRKLRPGSVETQEQERVVDQFCHSFKIGRI